MTCVLLHGLWRTTFSMKRLEMAISRAGFETHNLFYPSRKRPIPQLVIQDLQPQLRKLIKPDETVHFVTHSMGGILVRYLALQPLHFKMGRVVMLGSPNQGSEIVDVIGRFLPYRLINGPAGLQIGTGVGSLPCALPAPNFDVGIIAGTRSFNPISSYFLPGVDDGKVSVESSKLEGMTDFLAVPVSHTHMMNNRAVMGQTVAFLNNGRFSN